MARTVLHHATVSVSSANRAMANWCILVATFCGCKTEDPRHVAAIDEVIRDVQLWLHAKLSARAFRLQRTEPRR